MHDYFDLLGVAQDAPACEIRRASARHRRRPHPDFHHGEGRAPAGSGRLAISGSALPGFGDVAVDFVDLVPIVERMQASFFGSGR